MTPWLYKLMTDALVVFHFAFVAFVMLGGMLALRWNRIGFVHIPCVLWVIWIETSGNICPLTPLENQWRERAGLDTYQGGFVDHYIMPVLYPEDLTRNMQIGIAVGLIVLNLLSYSTIAVLRYRRKQRTAAGLKDSPSPTPDNAAAARPGHP